MTIEKTIAKLYTELDSLKARLVVDDEMMDHLRAIYSIAFATWYDPDTEAHRKWGEGLWPHITALNDKLRFKR
jgi:hypothetical protein